MTLTVYVRTAIRKQSTIKQIDRERVSECERKRKRRKREREKHTDAFECT